MGALVVGVVVLGLLLLLARGYVLAKPKDLAKGMRRSGGLLLGAAAVALAVTGRILFAFLLGGVAWVLLFDTIPPWNRPDYGLGGGQADARQKDAGAGSARPGAMSRAEALSAMEVGRRVADGCVASGARILATGEVGIGNTTAAASIVCALGAALLLVGIGAKFARRPPAS